MSRTFSRPGDRSPEIDRKAVLDFFEQRAAKAGTIGATRAVIYQDKNEDLAERRDAAEKLHLFPKLSLQADDRILDAGCGTGRWTGLLTANGAAYHGVDVSPGLIDVARRQFDSVHESRFTVCSIDKITLESIGASAPFSKIISFGVYIYLNDKEVLQALKRLAEVAAPSCRILFREPVGLDMRLTLKEHYSDDMDQFYSAIYRTESELLAMFDSTLITSGFRLIETGDVYLDSTLNNRSDTRQRFFLFER